MVENILGLSVGMSEINGVYGLNLSGIVPTSAWLGEILYEETCSRSNINQNILPDYLTCDRIKLYSIVDSQTGSATRYIDQLWTTFKHRGLSIFDKLIIEYSEQTNDN